MIELNDEQRHAAERGEPVEVIDPVTQRAYVLLAAEQYHKVKDVLSPPAQTDLEIPEGIRRSKDAFRRDLSQLLLDTKIQGHFIAYHREERIGIAADLATLMKEVRSRGLPDDEYDVGVIEPSAFVEEEEVDYGLAEYDEEPFDNPS